jgi:hypothetical protein
VNSHKKNELNPGNFYLGAQKLKMEHLKADNCSFITNMVQEIKKKGGNVTYN